jgi:hypothetical protein
MPPSAAVSTAKSAAAKVAGAKCSAAKVPTAKPGMSKMSSAKSVHARWSVRQPRARDPRSDIFPAERCVVYAARDISVLESAVGREGMCRSRTGMGEAMMVDANIMVQPVKVAPSPVAEWPMESDTEVEGPVLRRTVTWPRRVIEWR